MTSFLCRSVLLGFPGILFAALAACGGVGSESNVTRTLLTGKVKSSRQSQIPATNLSKIIATTTTLAVYQTDPSAHLNVNKIRGVRNPLTPQRPLSPTSRASIGIAF